MVLLFALNFVIINEGFYTSFNSHCEGFTVFINGKCKYPIMKIVVNVN